MVIDTYAVEMVPAEAASEVDTLAPFREQVRAEQAEKSVRTKMSESALMKLRAQREADRFESIGQERFKNALRSIIVTPENLQKLIARCFIPTATNLERRAQKLNYWIQSGYRLGEEIDSPTLIAFFSELTADEVAMSDSRFAQEWNIAAAAKVRQSRIRRGVIEEPKEVAVKEPKVKEPRICALKSKCLRAFKRKGAVVTGSGLYCSDVCKGAARVRKAREAREAQSKTTPSAATLETPLEQPSSPV